MYRKEAPWESAQKELLKINAYKVITGTEICLLFDNWNSCEINNRYLSVVSIPFNCCKCSVIKYE